jgi:hypothetical protein
LPGILSAFRMRMLTIKMRGLEALE